MLTTASKKTYMLLNIRKSKDSIEKKTLIQMKSQRESSSQFLKETINNKEDYA